MKDFLLVFRVLYRNRYAVEKESNSGKRRLTKPTSFSPMILPALLRSPVPVLWPMVAPVRSKGRARRSFPVWQVLSV